MGKGSRNRETRVVGNEANENVGAKLSKKQLIKLQQKKARTKKIITWIATAAIAIAVVAAIIIPGIGGLSLTFGKVTITTIACALILGILANTMLSGKKDKAE